MHVEILVDIEEQKEKLKQQQEALKESGPDKEKKKKRKKKHAPHMVQEGQMNIPKIEQQVHTQMEANKTI